MHFCRYSGQIFRLEHYVIAADHLAIAKHEGRAGFISPPQPFTGDNPVGRFPIL